MSGPPPPASAGYEAQLERARGLERSGEFEAALEAYRELARQDPMRREPLQGLRRLYAERGSWDAVLQVAELEIGLLAQADERARLLAQMARIWERELGDADQARALLGRAAEERKAGARRPEARRDEGPKDETPPATTLVQRAWLASARGDSQGAVAALQGALAADASDVEALDMLLTVLEGAERYAEMSDLLERRATLAADDATRAVVLARLGALRETHQGDLAGARHSFERALEADPGNRAARSALQRIYRRSEAWTALRSLLESAAVSGTAADRATASSALGALLEQQFGDPRGAQAAYAAALQLAPEDAEALEGLRRLRDEVGESTPGSARARSEGGEPETPEARRARAVAQLGRMLGESEPQGGDGRVAVGALQLERARGADALVVQLRDELLRAGPDQELSLQVELTSLLAGSQGAGAQALPHARRAAALAPRDTTLLDRALTAAHAAGGAFAALDLLDDLLASAPDLATRARLLAHRGDTLCDALGWNEEAVHAWREALEADPRHAGARARIAAVTQHARALHT